ncbi:hypothetical protein BDZ94DRAFT_1242542 [Collybia nuda]|uniref:Uncharacterized protein n=1 Tax=Collybia nuda TaxID=64659 RepID=A0A9P5YIZ8_9AGAR|nr:hypothetical protein BDZ94DRAFT_1242542 [Collybia nuda]
MNVLDLPGASGVSLPFHLVTPCASSPPCDTLFPPLLPVYFLWILNSGHFVLYKSRRVVELVICISPRRYHFQFRKSHIESCYAHRGDRRIRMRTSPKALMTQNILKHWITLNISSPPKRRERLIPAHLIQPSRRVVFPQ